MHQIRFRLGVFCQWPTKFSDGSAKGAKEHLLPRSCFAPVLRMCDVTSFFCDGIVPKHRTGATDLLRPLLKRGQNGRLVAHVLQATAARVVDVQLFPKHGDVHGRVRLPTELPELEKGDSKGGLGVQLTSPGPDRCAILLSQVFLKSLPGLGAFGTELGASCSLLLADHLWQLLEATRLPRSKSKPVLGMSILAPLFLVHVGHQVVPHVLLLHMQIEELQISDCRICLDEDHIFI
mmetsp:Transcript_4352/g.7678  ORF Transcript_4352/g.7678 Transcript_4352/m.7678 type:complete len:235 (-) Transcript_4352:662-1366(-)